MSTPQIERSLGRVEGKLDGLTDLLNKHLAATAKKDEAVDTRLNRLDRKVAFYAGGIALLAVLVEGGPLIAKVLQ